MGKIFSVEFLIQSIPQIAVYLPITLLITIASCVAGLIVGFFIALARYFEVRVLKTVAKVYISFIRGTPTMVQLVLVYYGIPILLRVMNEAWGTSFDINGIHPVVFAIITLGLNAAAYMSEIIRSALMSVDEGQVEACYSLNMTKWQALISVVIPQAFVVALPSLGNNFISLLKETSLVFNIAVVDIMAQAIAADGMTMIVVSHEMRFVKNVASRILFLEGGQIVEDNTPEKLFNNPENERTRAFLEMAEL